MSKARSEAAAKLGRVKSPAKAAAARENAKKATEARKAACKKNALQQHILVLALPCTMSRSS